MPAVRHPLAAPAAVAALVAAAMFAPAPFADAFPQPPESRKEPAAEAPTPPGPDTATALPDSAAVAAAAAAKVAKDRGRAEALYAKGYDETRDATRLASSGKAKDARKKYSKALDRFEEAVRLDANYFEAWNMVGYCARQTGDLKRSFDAYDRCLALNPDYEAAHEYRGEAYLMGGEIDKAKEELEWLRARQSAEAKTLEAAIQSAEQGKSGSSGSGGSW
ncbi:MAG TPA: tetratricopeptide repeat protein [Candidatus Eisenbacteria bacterium]